MKDASFIHKNQSLLCRLRPIIGHVPKAGEGVHRWLYISALKLRGQFRPEKIVEILRSAAAPCGRRVPDSEIQTAVKNSAQGAAGSKLSVQRAGGRKAWPDVDHAAVRRVVSSVENPLERLASATSWIGLPHSQTDFASAITGLLFPGNPLICAGETVRAMRCKSLSEWGSELSATQLIVPSPMTARTGVNKEGRDSNRCLANTGARRFLVVEFDSLSMEEQAAVHIHLAARYQLAVVVHSGGKSLHGWFFVAGRAEDELRGFMDCAVTLGADPHTWTRCQAVRTPGGLRRDGGPVRVQQVFFFNPNYQA